MVSEVITMLPFILVLVLISVVQNMAQENCPSDCICFTEYISNLESWQWIETDVNTQKDDPFHEDFNPYTEHNEVYDNPKAVKRRQQEKLLNTATCILRSNSSVMLTKTLGQLQGSVQILTLIQAPGSRIIKLEKEHLENLQNLIGLQIQGYSVNESESSQASLYIDSGAFSDFQKLAYLSLESVILIQKAVDVDNKKFNYTFSHEYVNDEQVIILKARSPTDETIIVPYSEYKDEKKTPSHPVTPEIEVAFTKLPALQHLRISGCNLQDISWDMFYKLDNLKFLLLDNNDLLFLPDFVFYATPNLAVLSLSNNRILNLQTVGLAGLLTLRKLDVSHNNIAYLSELSLPPFPFLEVADFRDNPITSIFPNTFEIMNSTKTLFLGSPSSVLEISTNSFYGLISLTRLDIVNIRVEFLERAMLKGMPELASLTMTGSIARIMYDAFSEVPKLEKLILKQCSIKKISMDAFFGLSSLIELDLSHNDISFLPPGIFEQQVSLREVFLQHNNLQTLPPSVFSKIPAKLIRLEGNPWHCSCDMKYWDSKQTNKIKRYHVPPPNSTFCDPQYYKLSACYSDYEPKFEAKYVYEKRVSPVCQTPSNFKNRNVFEVLRKGLHLCANSLQQNISILLTSSNPTETLEIMGTVRVPVQGSGNNKEKQLLFPPKVRKPKKVTAEIGDEVPVVYSPATNGPKESEVPKSEATEIVTPTVANIVPTMDTTFQTPQNLFSLTSTQSDTVIIPTPTVFTSPSTPEVVNRTRNRSRKNLGLRADQDIDDNRINVMWPPNSVKLRRQQQTGSIMDNNNGTQTFALSKKALRYMRAQQKQRKQQQQLQG